MQLVQLIMVPYQIPYHHSQSDNSHNNDKSIALKSLSQTIMMYRGATPAPSAAVVAIGVVPRSTRHALSVINDDVLFFILLLSLQSRHHSNIAILPCVFIDKCILRRPCMQCFSFPENARHPCIFHSHHHSDHHSDFIPSRSFNFPSPRLRLYLAWSPGSFWATSRSVPTMGVACR